MHNRSPYLRTSSLDCLLHYALFACCSGACAFCPAAAIAADNISTHPFAEKPPAVASFNDQPPTDVAAPSCSEKTSNASVTTEQAFYVSNLRHALVSTPLVTNMPYLKPLEKALATKRPFNEDMHKILSVHARTLLGLGALQFEKEIPRLYSAAERALLLMDKAEQAGLYETPEDLRPHLEFWRAMHRIDELTENAPWIVGPQQVTISDDTLPISIPKGYRLLRDHDVAALRQKQNETRREAIQKLTQNNSAAMIKPINNSDTHLIMPLDGSWSGSIFIMKDRYIPLDVTLPRDNKLTLEMIRTRWDPISNLQWSNNGNYSRDAVRWLIKPEKNPQQATIRWAMTDGTVAAPIGINFVHMTLGANQQFYMVITDFKVAEAFLDLKPLTEESPLDKKHYCADYQLTAMLGELEPLFESIKFKPEKVVEHSRPEASEIYNSIDALIVGKPSTLEKGISRMLEEQERKSNFWYVLQDRPRYMAYLLLGVGAILAAGAQSIRHLRKRYF